MNLRRTLVNELRPLQRKTLELALVIMDVARFRVSPLKLLARRILGENMTLRSLRRVRGPMARVQKLRTFLAFGPKRVVIVMGKRVVLFPKKAPRLGNALNLFRMKTAYTLTLN